MRKVWVVVVALAGVVLATGARADTVYLNNGQSIWGSEVYEEGDSVVIVRPSGDLRIPRSEVSRIERMQSNLPPFYTSPGSAPAGGSSSVGSPAGGTGTPGAPAPSGTPAPPSPGGATTQLPPPPPPPPTR
jgi:hypothetical protein